MNQETKIILEAMDGKFSKIYDKFDQIDRRFDSLEETLTKKIEDEVEGLAIMTANGFDRLETKLDRTIVRVDNHEARITKLEQVPI